MLNKYLYSNVNEDILLCINRALIKCIELGANSPKLNPENDDLSMCFSSLVSDTSHKIDDHITLGLYPSHQTKTNKTRERTHPRILKITINAFKDASEVKSVKRFTIPSPLNVLYHVLTLPQQPQTNGYSLASVRTLLLNAIEEYLKNGTVGGGETSIIDSISEEEVYRAVESFTRYHNVSGRWPKEKAIPSRANAVNFLVGHFLSIKGVAHLSFDNKEAAVRFLNYDVKKDFFKQFVLKITEPKFRVSMRYDSIPDIGEIINQLYGIPIPIRGADTLFFGGLKPNANGNLVIGLSGQTGIGKTSFALALANSLSPLGINCYYISSDEDSFDIEKRLDSLQTSFEKNISYYVPKKKWFYSVKLDLIRSEELIEIFDEFKTNIFQDVNRYSKDCNAIIVIDNLNDFIGTDEHENIKEIINEIHDLRCIVILVGGEGVLEELRLDYLIDIGIKLTHEGLEKRGVKPNRLINLYKSRHQLSRHGTHIFHLSGEKGFRISPQIPSQMDRKQKIKRNIYDENYCINTLNYRNEDREININSTNVYSANKSESFFSMYPKTHILIHGHGSSGKAGLSLKILLTPPISTRDSVHDILNSDFSNPTFQRKILILSFLYPEKYYSDLIFKKANNINSIISKVYSRISDPIVNYLTFYPGYLTPEDFINKIVNKLDEAILDGQPFTGVLIDGLHNVFLQFINLQDSDLVWPFLYSILSRYNLTVISTFTNFSIGDRMWGKNMHINSQHLPDYYLIQKGMTPFLHALVKASDYYFVLEQVIDEKGQNVCYLSIKGSINQDSPSQSLRWDRNRNVFLSIFNQIQHENELFVT